MHQGRGHREAVLRGVGVLDREVQRRVGEHVRGLRALGRQVPLDRPVVLDVVVDAGRRVVPPVDQPLDRGIAARLV